mgnify:CR=1 FL=1
MSDQSVLKLFQDTQALLQGHFLLTSGRHSAQYFQCAKVLQYPAYTTRLCEIIAEKFKTIEFDTVIAPAMGGIIVGQEVARLLNKRSIFAEREDKKLVLRRGFSLSPGERVLVCEDVVTTGGSVFETMEIVTSSEATIVGVGYIVDRSNGTVDFGVPSVSTLQLSVVSFQPDECPMCKEGSPLVKPGSRKILS